jgi:hypothetical protein
MFNVRFPPSAGMHPRQFPLSSLACPTTRLLGFEYGVLVMKLVMSSFLIAFASSALVAEAPAHADPSPAKIEAVSPERLNLARRFVGLSMSPDVYMEQVRVGFMASTSSQFDELVWAKSMAGLNPEFEQGCRSCSRHIPRPTPANILRTNCSR